MAYPPVHKKPPAIETFDRLEMLWDRYPRYHERTTFTDLDVLLEEHASYGKDFEGLREEYEAGACSDFLVRLSWSDLAYRYETKRLIQAGPAFPPNPWAEAFLDQFRDLDTDVKACFLFPESFVSQFFLVREVCRRAEVFRPVKSLFPDEDRVHFLAVFDKQEMDDVLLMFHLLYTSGSQEVFGGYSLYDYSLPWYQTHLRQEGVVLRSPYLPDQLARFQGNLPFYHNPAKTVYVRRNIARILENGYFSSELDFFICLTRTLMPFFQWWYQDLALYEEKEGYSVPWRLERTKIRTRLTAEGVIKPRWKHELDLFHAVRKAHPDTLYQYRPGWLGRQSLDLYIPSLETAIEYQGIQHYQSVDFFGGQEALDQRQALDRAKRDLCRENGVRLIEWPYSMEPTGANVRRALKGDWDSEPSEKGGGKETG